MPDIPLEETYIEAAPILEKIVRRFIKKYGHLVHPKHRDDIRTEAAIRFIQAYESYDGRTAFNTWLTVRVMWGLKKKLDRDWFYRRRRNRLWKYATQEKLQRVAEQQYEFSLLEYLEELSSDARMVVMLVLESPQDFRDLMMKKNSWTPGAYRLVIKSVLKRLGWTGEKITQIFAEIRGSL